MSIITDQAVKHEEQVQVLNDINARIFHKKLMELFVGTKVETVTMRTASDPTAPEVYLCQFVISSEVTGAGTFVQTNNTYWEKPDGSFDLTANGNAGMSEFLKCDMEFSTWFDIMTELATESAFIHNIYNLDTDVNQVVWTRDQYWVANVIEADRAQ